MENTLIETAEFWLWQVARWKHFQLGVERTPDLDTSGYSRATWTRLSSKVLISRTTFYSIYTVPYDRSLYSAWVLKIATRSIDCLQLGISPWRMLRMFNQHRGNRNGLFTAFPHVVTGSEERPSGININISTKIQDQYKHKLEIFSG